MENKNIKKIYESYLSKYVVICPPEESKEVIEEYKKTGKTKEGYVVERIDNTYKVWKNEENSKSIDEMKAEIEVDQAKNIRTIKNCILLFTICFIISLILSVISILIKLG